MKDGGLRAWPAVFAPLALAEEHGQPGRSASAFAASTKPPMRAKSLA
jgi:hypothetical protein